MIVQEEYANVFDPVEMIDFPLQQFSPETVAGYYRLTVFNHSGEPVNCPNACHQKKNQHAADPDRYFLP
jgi:hypothetical protein